MNENKDVLKSEEVQAMSNQFAERLQKEEKACQVYETLLQSYGLAGHEFETTTYEGETLTECQLGVGKVELKSEDYPAYYGGSYINDDGDLVIHVVGELECCQAKVEKVIQHKEGYVVKQAQYSYQKLLQLKEQFDELDMTEQQQEVFANVTAYGPNDENNVLTVEMNVLDQTHIDQFKQFVSDSDMIVFKQGEFAEAQATVHPGQIVFNSTSSSTATIRARRRPNGPMGVILSGHGTRHIGENIRHANQRTVIGRVEMRHWGGNTDAAFCRTSGVTLSNRIHQSNQILGPGIASAPVNTTVFLAGQRSGIRGGRVSAVNQTTDVTLNNGTIRVRMTGMSRAGYASQSGDSGGPIYRTVSGRLPIVGNHVAANGLFGLVNPILSRFNLSLT